MTVLYKKSVPGLTLELCLQLVCFLSDQITVDLYRLSYVFAYLNNQNDLTANSFYRQELASGIRVHPPGKCIESA